MNSKYTKTQRILALLGIIVMVALYLAALIASFFRSPLADGILSSALFCTFFIPIIIYLFQILAKNRKQDDSSFEDSI